MHHDCEGGWRTWLRNRTTPRVTEALSRPGSDNGIIGEAKATLRKDLSFIEDLDIS